MISKLVVPLGGMVALAAASFYYAEPQPVQPRALSQAPAALVPSTTSSPPTSVAAVNSSANLVPQAVAAGTTATHVPSRPDPALQNVAVAQTAKEKNAMATALRKADKEMQPAGFGNACFDQMRGIFCPIIGRIPVFREMAGQIATIGGFSCPLGSLPAAGT